LFDLVLFYYFQVLNKYTINSIDFGLKSHFEKTYIMWLSLIKSREGLNRNFSNKSRNRIGFKFKFYTCFSVWSITFCSDLGLQYNWWCWKSNKKKKKWLKHSKCTTMAQQQDTLGWDPTMCLVVVPLLYQKSVSIIFHKKKNQQIC